jgi:hypothetical protein
MDTSTFMVKKDIPDDQKLLESLGNAFPLWQLLKDYTHAKYPNAIDDWNFPGEKYGWSFRIKDKKRAILYFLPRKNYFKVALVFGQKATDQIMQSAISDDIKKELESARVYAEGRGIRIEVRDESIISVIKILIDIKIAN